MMFDERYFQKVNFSKKQIMGYLRNAEKNLSIAKKDKILDVKFNYAYTALLKLGITLLSFYGIKVRTMPGHHVKTIEKMAEILHNQSIHDIGNAMRSKRNLDLYGGGIEVTAKECREYIRFVEDVCAEIEKNILR